MQSQATTLWIDPRRWAALVRAYALFLVVTTIREYNATWHTILTAWLPDPGGAADMRILLQSAKVGLFFVPFVASQLLTALWLLSVRPRPPRADERSFQIALETWKEIQAHPKRFRSPWILVGAVAQPHLVSVLGKPFLILPRQGLAYYEHQLGPDAESAFRSVIAHEAGHLESWDDLLYFPWFAYTITGFAFCAVGLYLGLIGRLAFSQTFNHILILGGLALLGFYVVRRREAYSDSFSVVSLRSVEATERALQALGRESAGKKHGVGDTHFDVRTRLELLKQRGKPFLDMSSVDLLVAGVIYFYITSSPTPVSELSSGSSFLMALTLWLNDMASCALWFLLVLMIGGLSLARGGQPVGLLKLGTVGFLCLISREISQFMAEGLFSFSQIIMFFLQTFGVLIIGIVSFVLTFRMLNLWAIAILGRSVGDPRERLNWGALGIVAGFTLLETFSNLSLYLVARRVTSEGLEAAVNGSPTEQLSLMLPFFLSVLAFWISKAGWAVLIVGWSWFRSRSLPALTCFACGDSTGSQGRNPQLAMTCPHCGATLRSDLLLELMPERPVPG